MVTWSDPLNFFIYNEKSPLSLISGNFLFLFVIFYLIYFLLRNKKKARIVYLILFSIYFYYKTSGFYFLIMILMSVSDYKITKVLLNEFNWTRRKLLLATSIVIDLGVLCYFKYKTFFLDISMNLLGTTFDIDQIALPIGISFFVFQSISYVFDIYRGDNAKAENYYEYLFYISFFPHILMGPIVRAYQFFPQMKKEKFSLSKEDYNTAFFLITLGLIKKALIADYISANFVSSIMDSPESCDSGFECLLGIYGYTLQIYFDFSGYTDIAIGLSLLLGYKLPENFNRPYISATPTEFWRRWHITLSFWLRDYLYIPLGGNRVSKFRQSINLMVTMLIGGIWHGSTMNFIIWGGWHGLGLCFHKIIMLLFPNSKPVGRKMKKGWKIFGTILTFHFVCIGWIFFRVESLEKVYLIFDKIYYSFNLAIIPKVISAYTGAIVVMIIGYILVFIPENIYKTICTLGKSNSIYWKIIILVVTIWAIMQVKSIDIPSFIYFNF